MNYLELVKIDLGIGSKVYDELLTHMVETSKQLIAREGITLTDETEDVFLVVMYTGYLFRQRASNEPMPRMLRYALNNRLFAQRCQNGIR